jgi:hypothetical protein
MHKADQHVNRMLISLKKAERLLADCPPDFHNEAYHRAWRLVVGDCARACQKAFEDFGPVRSLSICHEFMEDFLPQFQQLNPTDQSYAEALERAEQYIRLPEGRLRVLVSHKAPGDQDSNMRYLGPDEGPLSNISECYSLPEYETPGRLQFQFAIWALMWSIQDVYETGGTPVRGMDDREDEDGWSWYCVRGTHASCVGNTISAWVETKWDELHRSHPELEECAMYLYPPVTKIWIEMWRFVAELIQNEAQK